MRQLMQENQHPYLSRVRLKAADVWHKWLGGKDLRPAERTTGVQRRICKESIRNMSFRIGEDSEWTKHADAYAGIIHSLVSQLDN